VGIARGESPQEADAMSLRIARSAQGG